VCASKVPTLFEHGPSLASTESLRCCRQRCSSSTLTWNHSLPTTMATKLTTTLDYAIARRPGILPTHGIHSPENVLPQGESTGEKRRAEKRRARREKDRCCRQRSDAGRRPSSRQVGVTSQQTTNNDRSSFVVRRSSSVKQSISLLAAAAGRSFTVRASKR